MDGSFYISYTVDAIDTDALRFAPSQLSFQLHAMTGRAAVSMGQKRVDVPTCSLLYFAHTLVYLTTMPLLYGTEEWEANIDHGLDMSSSIEGNRLRLTFSGLPVPPTVNFDIPPVVALADVGRFNGALVKEYYRSVGDQRKYFRISQLLPFASAKLIPQ